MLIWSLYQPGSVALHCWKDSAVVFNQLTGDTHQVGLLAVELLHILEQSHGESSAGLLEELQDVFSDVESSDSLVIIEDALSQLEALGLVKRSGS